MSITVVPITPEFVAEIGDADVSQPVEPAGLEAIKQAFWKYSVLIFPDQRLDQKQHLEFASLFGPLEAGTQLGRGDDLRLNKYLADVSNLDQQGELLEADSRLREYQLGNRLWHTDASFRRVPALCSMLYANTVVPVGGHTEFADQRAAYDALPDVTKRRLAGKVAEHSIFTSRRRMGMTRFTEGEMAALPPVPQVLVRTIPESGRKSLYVAAHAGRIFGMPESEGRALIDQLIEHVTQRQFVYTHRWRLHDLVIWDNRCTMHRGTEFDDIRWRRDMQRATVLDRANSCEQEGVRVPE
jgi:alpha-ketoglutarate-dependent 2,4-dichlorophenoxyacetate dioxygenase